MNTRNFSGKESFIFWGAGRWGRLLLRFFPELDVKAFIDKNPSKYGTLINDIPVMSFEDARKNYPEAVIIVTMLRSCAVRNVLRNKELIEHVDYFSINDFVPRYSYDVYNKLNSAILMLTPNNTCSLKCEGCLTYTNIATKKVVKPIDSLKRDIDLSFEIIDKTILICYASGESLLHPNIIDMVEYISNNYVDRIENNLLVTNGTIMLKDEEFERLSKCDKLIFSISNYSDREPKQKAQSEQLIAKLKEYNINHFLNTSSEEEFWHDVGTPTEDYNASNDDLNQRYSRCFKTPIGVTNGKLFYCTQEIWANMCTDTPLYEEDFIDMNDEIDREKLVNIMLRKPPKGHLEFCKHCKGRIYE